MRTLLFALVALASTLTAGDPPKLGPVIASQLIDATTSFNWHENGMSIAILDVETMTVTLSMVAAPKPPVFTTTYVDTSGNTQSISTTSSGTSNAAILTAITQHNLAVELFQSLFPPAPPG